MGSVFLKRNIFVFPALSGDLNHSKNGSKRWETPAQGGEHILLLRDVA